MLGANSKVGAEAPAIGNGAVGSGAGDRGGENLGSVGRGVCNPTRRPTDGTVPIRFGTYNIHNGRRGGLESALRGMSQANMDLGILQETKITNGVYTRGSAGYKVIATDAPSRHRGGVALFHRLHREAGCGAVEECDAAAVSARRISRDDCVAGRPAGVDAIIFLIYLHWKIQPI